ncbi:MAG: DUF4450 domain-containing protein, partial [Duncaniella sp.]|nr:DUF4450 domain-containing protein [Duncaniella sp.]
PYLSEAIAIDAAIDSVLWLKEEGHWAEFKDTMGKKRLHPDAALWTIYHAIDSEVGDPLSRYAAAGYIGSSIPHIPVGEFEGEEYSTVSTTDWKPYSWSINNVAIAEVMHTALALWQAGRSDEAYQLMTACALDNMYQGASPLNFGQISQYDAARGECYRDFADPIGVWSRALTEGLFGIRPDLLDKKVVEIIPGFPSDWDDASISLPDISYSFHRSADGDTSTYNIQNRYPGQPPISLVIPASGRLEVTVNGISARYTSEPFAFNAPKIRVSIPSEELSEVVVRRIDRGQMIRPTGRVERRSENCKFAEMTNGEQTWWNVIEYPAERKIEIAAGFDSIPSNFETVDLSKNFNARLNDLFRQEYVSPAPLSTTLRIPKHGIGEWCHPKDTAHVDNSGLRRLASRAGGVFTTSLGIPLRLATEGNDIIFTSLWDNYPDSITIPVDGNGSNLYLALAGTCNHMQHRMESGIITVNYSDGSFERVPLISPYNWAPIEQDFFNDEYAFNNQRIPSPMRLHLKTGITSRQLSDQLDITGVYGRRIEDGAGVLVDIPLDPSKRVISLTLETLSNDVIIGLMGLTFGK